MSHLDYIDFKNSLNEHVHTVCSKHETIYTKKKLHLKMHGYLWSFFETGTGLGGLTLELQITCK